MYIYIFFNYCTPVLGWFDSSMKIIVLILIRSWKKWYFEVFMSHEHITLSNRHASIMHVYTSILTFSLSIDSLIIESSFFKEISNCSTSPPSQQREMKWNEMNKMGINEKKRKEHTTSFFFFSLLSLLSSFHMIVYTSYVFRSSHSRIYWIKHPVLVIIFHCVYRLFT